MLTVHLRINDAATGKPTPVRLRITGPDSVTYPPLGRVADFPIGRNEVVGGQVRIGRDRWCYIDGACEVPLPSGVPLRIQASKGPEFTPLDESVTLGSGQMALRFTIARWSDLAADRWISADSRCHFLTPHSALLEAAAENLTVVNLLACSQPWPSFDGTSYPSFPTLTAFSGQSPALEQPGHIVAVNTLNVHPVLGSIGLLHSHRIVYPLTFGGEETDDWSVCDWCDQCHRKGGFTVWTDPFRPAGGLVAAEGLIAAILGKIDALEVDNEPRSQPLLPWVYRLWNAGFPLPLVGGSGKDSNDVVIGSMRTYSQLLRDEPLTYRVWIESVRSGRTFVTNGPLLKWQLTENVRGNVSVASSVPFDTLELIRDGEVFATVRSEPTQSIQTANLDFEVPGADSGWIAARVRGANRVFAHTSPLAVRGDHARPTEAALHLKRLVEQTREWIDTVGRFRLQKSKRHLLDLCAAALDRLGTTP